MVDTTITAISNLKGGVGKTVVTAGLAHAAASEGRSVLVVDADIQGNTTKHLTGYDPTSDPQPRSLADVLDRNINLPIEDAIIPARTRDSVHVLPSGFGELQAVQDQLFGKPGGELSVDRVLRPMVGKYDHILIDTRPALDLLIRSSLHAADNVLFVTSPEDDGLTGLSLIISSIDDLETYTDKTLPIAGIVINDVDGRRNDHAEVINDLKTGEIPVLGVPIGHKAEINKLTNVGLGMDQHPKRPAWSTNLHQNFITILKGITR